MTSKKSEVAAAEQQPSRLFDFLAQAKSALPIEIVPVTFEIEDPESGEKKKVPWKVTLRSFTARERDLFEADQLRRAQANTGNGAVPNGELQADLTNFRARLVSRHIIEDGMRTFANPKGEEILGDQPAAVMDKLFIAAQKLSGFTKEDVEIANKKLRSDHRRRTLFRLAERSGRTVGELETVIADSELIEWQIYWMIEPPLETRVDIGFAQLMALLAKSIGILRDGMSRGRRQTSCRLGARAEEWRRVRGRRPEPRACTGCHAALDGAAKACGRATEGISWERLALPHRAQC